MPSTSSPGDLSLPFLDLSLHFTAFPRPFDAFPFHCLVLTFHCLSLTFLLSFTACRSAEYANLRSKEKLQDRGTLPRLLRVWKLGKPDRAGLRAVAHISLMAGQTLLQDYLFRNTGKMFVRRPTNSIRCNDIASVELVRIESVRIDFAGLFRAV